MKAARYVVLLLFTTATLSGCANQTTDPRKGGLFSYNPKAYEQRLQERKEKLSTVEQSTQSAKEKSAKLETEKSAREKEKAELEAQLKELNKAVNSLKKNIQAKQAETSEQKEKRQRILAEINSIISAAGLADEMEDPEEKRLELERLRKKRDDLEKEAENLMLL